MGLITININRVVIQTAPSFRREVLAKFDEVKGDLVALKVIADNVVRIEGEQLALIAELKAAVEAGQVVTPEQFDELASLTKALRVELDPLDDAPETEPETEG